MTILRSATFLKELMKIYIERDWIELRIIDTKYPTKYIHYLSLLVSKKFSIKYHSVYYDGQNHQLELGWIQLIWGGWPFLEKK